jgi:hypothetical protein
MGAVLKDQKRESNKKDKGSALISVLMMSLVLFAFVIAISILMNQRFHSINLRQAQSRAKFAAQAGVTRSLQELSNNIFWDAGFGATPLEGDAELTYQVEVFNNFSGTDGQYAPDGKTWVPQGTVWVRSVGTMGQVSSGSVGLIGMVGQYRPTFDHAVFGDRQVTITGTSLIQNVAGGGQADVGSNALGGPAIQITSGSSVSGKALCAPTADPSDPQVILVSGATVGGKEAANETKVVLPFPNKTGVLDPNTDLVLNEASGENTYNLWPGDYTDITINKNCTLVLSAPDAGGLGRYHLSGDLTVNEGGTIRVENVNPDYPVTLYVKGNINFTKAIIGLDENSNPLEPQSLQIYFTEDPNNPGPDASVMTMNDSTGYFVSAGDTADYNLTGSNLTGAIIGRTITFNSSQAYYEETLRNVPLQGQGDVTLLLEDDVPPSVAQEIAEGNPPPPEPPTEPDPKDPPAPPEEEPDQPGVVTDVVAPLSASDAENAATVAQAAATGADAATTGVGQTLAPSTAVDPVSTTSPAATTGGPADTTTGPLATTGSPPATTTGPPTSTTTAPAPTSIPATTTLVPAPASVPAPAPVPATAVPAPASVVVPIPVNVGIAGTNVSTVVPVPGSILPASMGGSAPAPSDVAPAPADAAPVTGGGGASGGGGGGIKQE